MIRVGTKLHVIWFVYNDLSLVEWKLFMIVTCMVLLGSSNGKLMCTLIEGIRTYIKLVFQFYRFSWILLDFWVYRVLRQYYVWFKIVYLFASNWCYAYQNNMRLVAREQLRLSLSNWWNLLTSRASLLEASFE